MDKATDTGNAERFVAQHGTNAKYCNKMRSWYLWNGKSWALDDKQAVSLLAVDTARNIGNEAASATDITETMKLNDWAKKSLQRNRLANMVALAQPHLPITPDELDTNPWLLSVQNGTVDLKSGELLPHTPDHYITKVAPVEYAADATCPMWESTINTLLGGDQDLIRYMQKVIGYALTGDVKEKCFFVLHGTGDNGKTLFINAVMNLLGDYASSTTMDTFIVTGPGAASNDVMRLKGARLAMASEAEKQFSLAEAKIKRLTGSDMYTARLLYREPIDFYPTFKIFLLTNQIPRFNVTDVALMNRIHLVPFAVTIPKEEQDKDLLDKLKSEASGMLNWAIRGCLLWQREGLTPPRSVVNALEDHRLEVDVLARFMGERCVLEQDSKVGVTQLHEAYRFWSGEHDLDALGLKAFNTELKARGFKRGVRCAAGDVWANIRLDGPPADDATVAM
jgi:putative DNA primase/helicase